MSSVFKTGDLKSLFKSIGVKDTIVNEVVTLFLDILTTMAAILNLDINTSMLNGESVEAFKICPQFKVWVRCARVVAANERLAINLAERVKYTDTEGKVLSASSFMLAQSEFLSYLRVSAEPTEVIQREEKLVSEVMPYVTDGGECHYSDTPFIPVELVDDFATKFVKGSYFNYSNESMLIDFLTSWFNGIRAR